MTTANLPQELEQLPDALIVPLGRAVEGALAYLGFDGSRRMLRGFPHPSGGNEKDLLEQSIKISDGICIKNMLSTF